MSLAKDNKIIYIFKISHVKELKIKFKRNKITSIKEIVVIITIKAKPIKLFIDNLSPLHGLCSYYALYITYNDAAVEAAWRFFYSTIIAAATYYDH